MAGTRILKWFLPYVLIQSFQFQFAKDSLQYSSPFVTMAIRYLVAGSILLAVSRSITRDKYVFAIAAFTSGSTMFWILGLQYVSTGDSAVLSYSTPLFAIPAAAIFLNEKTTKWGIVGALVGFSGVTIYASTLVHGSLLVGAIFSLLGTICWVGFSTLFRKVKHFEPFSLVGTQFLIGSIPFLVGSIFFRSVNFTGNYLFDVIYVAVPGGALQYFLWYAMVRVEKLDKITTMTFAIPASTVAIQSVEYMQFPNPISILGAAIMFVGIYLSNSKGSRSKGTEVTKQEGRLVEGTSEK